MVIYFATDHSGFYLKNQLKEFVTNELGFEVVDCGAKELNPEDDYPDFVKEAAAAVSQDPENTRAIILGASGQGEAMAANRFNSVRAAVFYGYPSKPQTDADGRSLDMIESVRQHNNANILSLGARFVDLEEAKAAIRHWLEVEFTSEDRHQRRIAKLDN